MFSDVFQHVLQQPIERSVVWTYGPPEPLEADLDAFASSFDQAVGECQQRRP